MAAAPATASAIALARLAGPGRVALLVGLMTLVAASEGVGILLLVPLLAALTPGGAAGVPGPLGALAAELALAPLLALFVAVVALRAALQFARQLAGARLERRIVARLRARALDAVLHAEWRALAGDRQGETLSVLVGEVERVGYGSAELAALAAALLALGAAFLAALALAPAVALAALAGGALVLAAYAALRRRAHALGEALSFAWADLNARLGETLGALRVTKSFAAEQRSADAVARIEDRLTAARLGFQVNAGLGQAGLQIAGALVAAGFVWLAVARWGVPAAVLLPLVALFARVLPLLGAVQQHWQAWLNARPALAAVEALVARLAAVAEPRPAAGVTVAAPRRSIALAGVGVRHEGRGGPVLAGIDLELPVATTTALVGPSGAGKSTLADVLGGLAAPDAGALLLDGRALAPAERIAWRGHVAYVQQEPVLFNTSIRDNLLWAAPEADDARLVRALEQASADFVLALPAGLDTPAGEAGRRLSGGERQRIVLARALLRAPALLILDEATSALDPANEAAIAAAVARMRGRVTLLIVGHRGALAEAADQVVRLEHGRIVARRGRIAAA